MRVTYLLSALLVMTLAAVPQDGKPPAQHGEFPRLVFHKEFHSSDFQYTGEALQVSSSGKVLYIEEASWGAVVVQPPQVTPSEPSCPLSPEVSCLAGNRFQSDTHN